MTSKLKICEDLCAVPWRSGQVFFASSENVLSKGRLIKSQQSVDCVKNTASKGEFPAACPLNAP